MCNQSKILFKFQIGKGLTEGATSGMFLINIVLNLDIKSTLLADVRVIWTSVSHSHEDLTSK
jgi:hypothetical protein